MTDPHRALIQHALCSRLMGVDFAPVYRAGGAPSNGYEPSALFQDRPMPAPSGPNRPRPASKPTSQIEAKPENDLDWRDPDPKPSTQPDVRPSASLASPPRDAATVQAELDTIRESYEADAPHQHFVTDHTRIVFGEGDPCARLMFVGEAPGAEEDKTGRPFIGRAGQLLEKMIVAMGLSRERVYITNVLKTRPPGNATPTVDEAMLCAPYLYRQISAIRPAAIVTLGLPATRLLLETNETMGRMRGTWRELDLESKTVAEPEHHHDGAPASVPVMPTYHPAYLLRSYTPDNRAKVWSDLQQVMDRLGLQGPA